MWTRMWVPLTVGVVVCGLVVGSGGVAEASHDGNPGRVAYVDAVTVGDATFFEVFTMNPDGSDQRRVALDGGTFVKHVTDYEGYTHSVYTTSTDPRWLPDGSTLAFLHYSADDRYEIRAVDADGRNLRTLFDDWEAGMVTWSPDGRRIAYADERGVWVADGDGTDPVLVAEPSLGLPPVDGEPSEIEMVKWSPDGTKLAFIEWSRAPLVAGSSFVTVVNVDGTNRIGDLCNGGPPRTQVIDWSPDGRALTCDLVGNGDIVQTVESDGSNLTVVANGQHPVWSPDGTQILYSTVGLASYAVASGEHAQILSEFGGYFMDWQAIQGTFWDDERSVFIADIEWMAAEGITKGCNPPANDRFCPNSDVTRGQMAAFLRRAFDLPSSSTDFFTDDDGSVFEADINALAASGITKGCNPPAGDQFCPGGKVTREQMAAFMKRAFDYPASATDFFIDDDDSIFEGDINSIAEVGVTRGCNPVEGNTRYCPKGYVTRGQMAAFLHRAMG